MMPTFWLLKPVFCFLGNLWNPCSARGVLHRMRRCMCQKCSNTTDSCNHLCILKPNQETIKELGVCALGCSWPCVCVCACGLIAQLSLGHALTNRRATKINGRVRLVTAVIISTRRWTTGWSGFYIGINTVMPRQTWRDSEPCLHSVRTSRNAVVQCLS